MNKSIAIAAVLSFLACGESREYVIGQTTVVIWDYAEPWKDFPEVMRNLQKTNAGIPEELWSTRVHFYPAGIPLTGASEDALCYFRYADGEIRIRPTGDSTFQGCLGHEFAHRWVYLEKADKDCKQADVHQCKGFKERIWRLQKEICSLSWDYNNKHECPKLFKDMPEFVDGELSKDEKALIYRHPNYAEHE